jgi:hypothetical protein|tara:strand:+ start:332 stop:598 length:267 start_codon:yes stop_codon:yes gene_type:complete
MVYLAEAAVPLSALNISDLVLKNVVQYQLNYTNRLGITLLPLDNVQFSIIISQFAQMDKTLSSLKIMLHLNTYPLLGYYFKPNPLLRK